MAFKKPEMKIQPVDLASLAPAEAERKIIDSVRKYATRQDNWARADKNTPFLGQITGMGIESSNRVDITMAIERLFLTRRTKRVPLGDGTQRFRLEEGDLGRLMILEGEDTFAATPGLAVKMLMDLGHMPADPEYLSDVVSFAAVVVVGEGQRIHDSLKRARARLELAADPAARSEAQANVEALAAQARGYLDGTTDPDQIARSRFEAFQREKSAYAELSAEQERIGASLKELSAGGDPAALESLRSRQTALRLRMSSAALSLSVAQKVSSDAARSSAADQGRVAEVRAALAAALEARECSSATT